MSRRGNCYDNAVVASFFATLEHELGATADWRIRDTAAVEVTDFIEIWYNRQRRHSSLGYQSPAHEAHQSSAGPVRRVAHVTCPRDRGKTLWRQLRALHLSTTLKIRPARFNASGSGTLGRFGEVVSHEVVGSGPTICASAAGPPSPAHATTRP